MALDDSGAKTKKSPSLNQLADIADFAAEEYGGLNRREFTKLVGALTGFGGSSLAGCIGSGPSSGTSNNGSNASSNKDWNDIKNDIEGELTVNTFGGSLGKTIKKIWIEPFKKKYDIKVNVVTGKEANQASIVQAVNSGNSPGMDVSFHQLSAYYSLASKNVFEPLPANQIPIKSDLFDICKKRYGLGNIFYSSGLAYNSDKIDEPTSWEDMWSKKHKGKVSTVTSVPEWTVEVSNLAMGNDMYPWNDKTWKKLSKLRPQVPALAFRGAETSKLFQEGTINLSLWFNGRTYLLADNGFPIDFKLPKEGGIPRFDPYVVYKTADHPNAAKAYINFILQKKQQKKLAQNIYYASTNTNVSYPKKLREKVIPSSPKQMNQMQIEDWDYINNHESELTTKFQQWQNK